MIVIIRKLEINELGKLYRNHIKKDFPPTERPPCCVIKNNIKNKLQEGFIFLNQGEDSAYSINALSEDAILIFLFAVFEGKRGNGIGSKFLKEIIEYYKTKDSIIVEVERPEDAKSLQEKVICEKRISFYERLGFVIQKDIEYSIFDVPMYLMVYSNKNISKEKVINQMKTIYGLILRKRFQNMLKIK